MPKRDGAYAWGFLARLHLTGETIQEKNLSICSTKSPDMLRIRIDLEESNTRVVHRFYEVVCDENGSDSR